METIVCPICQQQASRLFQKYGYWICRCKTCGHRFAETLSSADHVSRVYQDDYFKGGSAGYPDYLSEAQTLVEHGRQYGALLHQFTRPGKILDVGSAAGFILQGFQETGWSGVGVEPNFAMSQYGRTQLGLQIETGCLEEFSFASKFDVICMIQVVAHFFDIRKALERAAKLTLPGGFWLIETWDRESWPARLLGKHWHEYSPPSVLHWFSPAGLASIAAQFGLVEVARGKPVKRINARHAKSLLRYKLQGSPFAGLPDLLVLLPDDKVIRYPAFDLFWILFQKQANH